MLLQLILESFVRDGTPRLTVGVFEQRHRQVLHLILRKLHSVFLHARAHHVLQFPVLYETIACTTKILSLLFLSVYIPLRVPRTNIFRMFNRPIFYFTSGFFFCLTKITVTVNCNLSVYDDDDDDRF